LVLNLNEEALDILASNEYVAFVGSEEGGPDIYLMNLENRRR
jgi:Tol biopolymer transport system component